MSAFNARDVRLSLVGHLKKHLHDALHPARPHEVMAVAVIVCHFVGKNTNILANVVVEECQVDVNRIASQSQMDSMPVCLWRPGVPNTAQICAFYIVVNNRACLVHCLDALLDLFDRNAAEVGEESIGGI